MWLSDLHAHGLVQGSFVPPTPIQRSGPLAARLATKRRRRTDGAHALSTLERAVHDAVATIHARARAVIRFRRGRSSIASIEVAGSYGCQRFTVRSESVDEEPDSATRHVRIGGTRVTDRGNQTATA
jgi:hypothetical protein